MLRNLPIMNLRYKNEEMNGLEMLIWKMSNQFINRKLRKLVDFMCRKFLYFPYMVTLVNDT